MKKLLALTCLLALSAFGLAACGGDDGGGGMGDSSDTSGGGGQTVSLSANPEGDLAFEQDSLEANAGSVTVELTNDADIPHDVCIESPEGEDVGCSDTVSGDTTELSAEVEPGDYTFYCSVDGHRDQGMEGTLSVK